MWAYLKSKNSSEPEEFVVVGVNSIFLTTENSQNYEICKDVCKKYKWLDSLEKLRKITAFGYVYCCEVTEELKEKLDGFPMEKKQEKLMTKQMKTNEINKLEADELDESTTSDYEDDFE